MGAYDHLLADILDEVGLRGRSEQNIECLINTAFRSNEDTDSYRDRMKQWSKANGIEVMFLDGTASFFCRAITSPYSHLKSEES